MQDETRMNGVLGPNLACVLKTEGQGISALILHQKNLSDHRRQAGPVPLCAGQLT